MFHVNYFLAIKNVFFNWTCINRKMKQLHMKAFSFQQCFNQKGFLLSALIKFLFAETWITKSFEKAIVFIIFKLLSLNKLYNFSIKDSMLCWKHSHMNSIFCSIFWPTFSEIRNFIFFNFLSSWIGDILHYHNICK